MGVGRQQQHECVDGDLPFGGLDGDSLVEEMRDISQQQGKSTIQNDKYHQVKKVYRKRKLSSGEIEYEYAYECEQIKRSLRLNLKHKRLTIFFIDSTMQSGLYNLCGIIIKDLDNLEELDMYSIAK